MRTFSHFTVGNCSVQTYLRCSKLLFFTLTLLWVHPCSAQTDDPVDIIYETVTYGGHSFSIPDTQLPWKQASEECITRGELLVSIETPEKDDILVKLFSENQHTNVTLKGNSWISATEVREGVWYWDSLKKPTYYQRWFMDGQPDDKDNLNCVYIAASAMLYWRDANCSASMYYICESRVESDLKTTVAPSSASSSSGQVVFVFLLIFVYFRPTLLLDFV